jgi:DNA-binding NarL/FixJ family response regulator
VSRGKRYVSPLIGSGETYAAPAQGNVPPSALTPRQREVLHLVAAGKRMKEIAAELRVSRRTVEMHKYQMMRTLGFRTSAELIQYYFASEGLRNKDP